MALQDTGERDPQLKISLTPRTGEVNATREDLKHWSARGFSLQAILSQVWKMDYRLVFLPRRLQRSTLYDFVLDLPNPLGEDERDRLIQEEIKRYFQIRVVYAHRAMPVLVLTAPSGAAAMERLPDTFDVYGGGAAGGDRELSVQGMTMQGLGDFLGRILQGFVVEETGLDGRYSFQVKSKLGRHGTAQLLAQVGLVLAPEERTVRVLAVSGT